MLSSSIAAFLEIGIVSPVPIILIIASWFLPIGWRFVAFFLVVFMSWFAMEFAPMPRLPKFVDTLGYAILWSIMAFYAFWTIVALIISQFRRRRRAGIQESLLLNNVIRQGFAWTAGIIVAFYALLLLAFAFSGSPYCITAHAIGFLAELGILYQMKVSKLQHSPFGHFIAPTLGVSGFVLIGGVLMSPLLPFYVQWDAERLAGQNSYSFDKFSAYQSPPVPIIALSQMTFITAQKETGWYHIHLNIQSPNDCDVYNWSFRRMEFDESSRFKLGHLCSAPQGNNSHAMPYF